MGVEQYHDAAMATAAQVVATPALLQTYGGCSQETLDAACGHRLVDAVGERLFRRPLEDAERMKYRAILAAIATGADGGTDPGLLARTQAYRQSMLDAVEDDTVRLTSRLGASDRRRMEQHLEGVRALELRLQEREQMPTASSGCTAPVAPGTQNFGDGGSHEEKEAKSALMSELLAHALACDLSRVFSYEFSATQSHAVYWEVGISDEHHPLTHSDKGGPQTAAVTRFIMKNFAQLASRLKAMPEGSGNVLDNTLILATSEHANAGSHNYSDHPYLMVGKAGGGLNAGMHYRGSSGMSPRVLLTAVQAIGLPVTKLGQTNSDGNRVAIAPISELLKSG